MSAAIVPALICLFISFGCANEAAAMHRAAKTRPSYRNLFGHTLSTRGGAVFNTVMAVLFGVAGVGLLVLAF